MRKENRKIQVFKRKISLAMALILCMTSTMTVEAAGKKYVKSLKLSKGSVVIAEGKKVTLNAVVSVKGSASKKVKISAGKSGIVSAKAGSASKKGVTKITITAKKKGSATITVKTVGRNKKKKVLSKKLKVTVTGASSADNNNADNGSNTGGSSAQPTPTVPGAAASTAPGTGTPTNAGGSSAQPTPTAPGAGAPTDTGSSEQPMPTAPGTAASTAPGTGGDAPESTDGNNTSAPQPTPSAGAPASGGFTEKDYSVKKEVVRKLVKFVVNETVITPEELEAQGYTIETDGNRKVASRMNTLARVTYTFDKLPTTYDEIKQISLKSDKKKEVVEGTEYELDYGMCAPMVASVLAMHIFEPTTRLDTSHPIGEFFDWLNGTNSKTNVTSVTKQFINGQLIDNANLKNCYFGGASPSNAYTPSTPYTITVEEGPYYIPAKESDINYGKTPERCMSFIYNGVDQDGNAFPSYADDARYVDVFLSSDGNWYIWNDQFKNILASIKAVEEGW